MDDLTHSMQVIKTDQTLLSHLPDNWQRSTFVIIPFDYFQQIATENLEHSDKVLSVRSVMKEAIQKLNAIAVISGNVFELLRLLLIKPFKRIEPLFLHPIR